MKKQVKKPAAGVRAYQVPIIPMQPIVEVGKSYLFRSVTYHQVGTVVAIVNGPNGFVSLKPAAWVADSGRFMNALRDGTLNEVEPFPHGCVVNLAAVVDIAPWNHPVPDKQK